MRWSRLNSWERRFRQRRRSRKSGSWTSGCATHPYGVRSILSRRPPPAV